MQEFALLNYLQFAHLWQLSWFLLYMCECPSIAAELLTNSLSAILDQMAPIRTIQVRILRAKFLGIM